MTKILNMAMVGGGLDSLIGPVHLKSATLFGEARLIGGVFSSRAQKSRDAAERYHLSPDRGFASLDEMIAWDRRRPVTERINFFTVCTPNHLHCRDAKTALENGYHVVCDKPLSHSIDEARAFVHFARSTDRVFALTHNYTGYPIIRYLRSQIERGSLGHIRAVRIRYLQGWLAESLEKKGHKQASWRTDPDKSGVSGCFADIGTHAFNLMRFTTDLHPQKISANLEIFARGRSLDDYGQARITTDEGAIVQITASQISQGYRNHFVIEVDGSEGSATWCQEEPEVLTIRRNHTADERIHREQVPCADTTVTNASSLPAGHPEGYLEAFANIYKDAFVAMRTADQGQTSSSGPLLFPGLDDGLEGMQFIDRAVESSKKNGMWLDFSA